MKKILFISSVIDSGGVAKSLVNTLNAIDYNKFNVDLFVLSGKFGVYSEYIPDKVNIITNKDASNAFLGIKGFFLYLSRFQFLSALIISIRLVLSFFSKSYSAWMLSRLFPKLKEEYDLIVDYNGQHQLYYMIDKLKSKIKLSFFHSDYNKWPYYKSMDKKYYKKVDRIFTISPLCVESLKNNFPESANKVSLFENISSPQVINNMAKEEFDSSEFHGLILVTLASVWYNKGIDLAIEASSILKKKKIDYSWLFIGKMVEEKWLKIVKERGLQDNMYFLGIKANPYPYMKSADIIVHPSRFEGKSIALDEAKILCKPIVVTNFSTVNDQFKQRVNASICEMTGESIADSIIELLNNAELRNSYISNLRANIVDNSNEINKLLSLIN